jgi:hypothetical protein
MRPLPKADPLRNSPSEGTSTFLGLLDGIQAAASSGSLLYPRTPPEPERKVNGIEYHSAGDFYDLWLNR